MSRRLLLLAAGGGGSFTLPLADWVPGTLTPDGAGSRVTLVDDGQHNAFPGLARLDATRILCVYRRGTGHLTGGDIYGKIGTQSGTSVSWGSAFLIYSHATEDVRCEDAVSIIDNKVVVVGRLYDGSANHSPFLVIANDAPASFTSGTTWGSPISIPLTTGTSQNAGIGRIHKLANGSYLVGFNHTSPASVNGVLISSSLTDWSARTLVNVGTGFTELDVEEMPDETLVAHLRQESPKTFYYATSSDHGATWTTPASLFNAWGLPTFRRLPTGLQLAVNRQSVADYHNYWRQSVDDGATWSAETALDDGTVGTGAVDSAYATILSLDDTHALVAYGIEQSADPGPSSIYSQVFTDTSTRG